ncbi:hypothetical protein [Arthrobacter sp. PAMC25564]|uniref:hypothetical protein n=1 Tax=Arthrobacter sp. PAMC25564 TaxID=2565366 RepID=UPI001F0DFB50|nr:hypothetical protein [Arthrobacter sp. PAMC25564]
MTQTAAQDPFPQQAEGPGHPDQRLPGAPFADDAVPDAPDPGRAPWWWGAVIAAAGIPVGLLWWVLAPSGLNLLSGDPALSSGSNTSAWLPRDLVLAGLFLLAGCITGTLVSGTRHDEPTTRTVALAVASAAAGALIAWGVGVLAGQWWGEPQDASANASTAFSLRSYQLLAVWPAAVALAAFLGIVFRKPAPAGETTA